MIRPMRGQVVIEEIPQTPSATLWTPDPSARSVKTHTGRVLAMGPPARTSGGAEVPHGFAVGDLVQFHFIALEELSTNTWGGVKAVWIPQAAIDGVWICGNDFNDKTCARTPGHEGLHNSWGKT